MIIWLGKPFVRQVCNTWNRLWGNEILFLMAKMRILQFSTFLQITILHIIRTPSVKKYFEVFLLGPYSKHFLSYSSGKPAVTSKAKLMERAQTFPIYTESQTRVRHYGIKLCYKVNSLISARSPSNNGTSLVAGSYTGHLPLGQKGEKSRTWKTQSFKKPYRP